MKQGFRSLPDIIDCMQNRVFLIITAFFLLIPISGYSQKRCTNPPSLSLSASNGTTCYLSPVTIADNTFGGNATAVTISSDGNGTIVPEFSNSSPFNFTYIPDSNDAGSVVTITVTTNNPQGSPCRAASDTYQLTVISNLPPPDIGNIIQTTCTSSTGSIELSGLPTYADWTITTSPGEMTTEGSGSVATIHNLAAGIYSFTVSVSAGCSSSPSAQAEISEQPGFPTPPLPGTISVPTCETATGSVMMTGLPSEGTWTLIRYPGTVTTTGNGTSGTVPDLPPGTFNFTVTSAAGCVSGLSANVTIPGQPLKPAPPVIGTIVQPTGKSLRGV